MQVCQENDWSVSEEGDVNTSHSRPRFLCLPSALSSGCLLERRLCVRTGFRVALNHAWCMDYVLEFFCFGYASNSLQYGHCVESLNSFENVWDCMDSVCKWIAILAGFFFLHQCRCGHRDRCDTGLINVHM